MTAIRSDMASASSSVVRDVDEGGADVVLDRLQLQLHLLAELHVQRPERLVEKQRRRRVHERTREGDALLLPARELSRPTALEALELDDAQHLGDASAVSPRTFLTFSPKATLS